MINSSKADKGFLEVGCWGWEVCGPPRQPPGGQGLRWPRGCSSPPSAGVYLLLTRCGKRGVLVRLVVSVGHGDTVADDGGSRLCPAATNDQAVWQATENLESLRFTLQSNFSKTRFKLILICHIVVTLCAFQVKKKKNALSNLNCN